MDVEFPDGAEFGRRYSAVAISDDRISQLSDLRRLVGTRIGGAERLPSPGGTTMYRVELLDSVSRYSTFGPVREPGSQQPHLGYVAFLKGRESRTTFLVSPFSRLLGRVVRDLDSGVDPPMRGYFRFEVGNLISSIRDDDLFDVEDVAAVTLRVTGDASVDLVRLTGSAPLVSTLLAEVQDMRVRPGSRDAGQLLAIPYGVVMRINEGLDHPVRLSIDRHGNVHWYQLGEPAVGAVVEVLRRIEAEAHIVSIDRRLPVDQNKLSDPH